MNLETLRYASHVPAVGRPKSSALLNIARHMATEINHIRGFAVTAAVRYPESTFYLHLGFL